MCEGATLTKAPDFATYIIDVFVDHRIDAALARLSLAADFSGSESRIEALPPADIRTAARLAWSVVEYLAPPPFPARLDSAASVPL